MPAPPLACLGETPAPAEVERDLARVVAWPPEALAELWSVLGPSLRARLDQRVEAVLDAFVQRHGVAAPDLALALKAARFLLHEAARRGTSWELFEADLRALLGDRAGALVLVLAPRYAEALELVRFETLRAALLDHGDLYVGAEWRLDAVLASTRARSLGARVGVLTLKYRSATSAEQLTLQILPADLVQLRGVIDELIEAADEHRPAG